MEKVERRRGEGLQENAEESDRKNSREKTPAAVQ
jgi:hypothetical protein